MLKGRCHLSKCLHILPCNYALAQPGPASLEVEHSLRKYFIHGDRGSNLAEDLSFQAARSYFAQLRLTEISDYRTSYITHATLDRNKL